MPKIRTTCSILNNVFNRCIRMATKIDKDEIAEANPPTLQKLFEDSSIAKLLDFLTLYKDFDYPKTEISRNSGVSWKTLYRLWPILGKVQFSRKNTANRQSYSL